MPSCPEILRRDSKAFADRTVSLADLLREREYGSDSSLVEVMRELQHESPYSSRSSSHSSVSTILLTPVSSDLTHDEDDEDEGLLDWLSAPQTPVIIGLTGSEEEDMDMDIDMEEEMDMEEDMGASHNLRRVARSRTLLTRSVVDLLDDVEDSS